MSEGDLGSSRPEPFWKRGWFVGGLAAIALLLAGLLLGLMIGNESAPFAAGATSTSPGLRETTASPEMNTTTTTTPLPTTTTSRPITTTSTTTNAWDSTAAALAEMIECGDVTQCEVEWPNEEDTAQEMPESIYGYEASGTFERSDFRVLGDGSASVTTIFPYLLSDCATQVWTARWRSVTGKNISGAVIPATPDAPPDQPWDAAWGWPPAPSQAGFLAGFGCSQPAWTFVDSDPEVTVIADGVVEWQTWLASP